MPDIAAGGGEGGVQGSAADGVVDDVEASPPVYCCT
jgi:hypothetical protein